MGSAAHANGAVPRTPRASRLQAAWNPARIAARAAAAVYAASRSGRFRRAQLWRGITIAGTLSDTMIDSILLALCAVAMPAARIEPAPCPALTAGDEHGKLAWFNGSFDDAVREASRTKKLVFIDFWTTWCGWCKKLDADTYSNAAVVSAMKDFVCLSIDAESKDGAPLARKFNVSGYPTLVFLDSDGALRDRSSGYMAPERFLKEVKRIRSGDGTLSEAKRRVAAAPEDVFARLDLVIALRRMNDTAAAQSELDAAKRAIAQGHGFDTKSTDERWKLSQKLAEVGDADASNAQLDALRALDPDGKSIASRRMKLQELTHAINVGYARTHVIDLAPLLAFLHAEADPGLQFEGWGIVQKTELFQVNDARKRERPDEEEFHRAAWRDAGREAWKHCPPEQVADWGATFAAAMYEDAEHLTNEEKDLAIDVATRACEAAPKSPPHMEVLACCLFAAGKRDDALRTLKSALDIDPDRASLKSRMAEFTR
jgi:thioredoxin-related protein